MFLCHKLPISCLSRTKASWMIRVIFIVCRNKIRINFPSCAEQITFLLRNGYKDFILLFFPMFLNSRKLVPASLCQLRYDLVAE